MLFNEKMILIALGLAGGLFACQNTPPVDTAAATPVAPAAAPASAAAAAPALPGSAGGVSGKVVERVDVEGYTYVAVEQNGAKIWAAGPKVAVKTGDTISTPAGSPMMNFHSKTLNRTFETLYFVQQINVAGSTPSAPTSAPGSQPTSAPAKAVATPTPATPVVGIKMADGGLTVAGVYAGKADLKGKSVTVRGKVMKFNPSIMGKNWLHIQDGSGGPGTNDLTVTTQDTAAVGATVLVKATVATDKDFGGGYAYKLILEEAKLTVE